MIKDLSGDSCADGTSHRGSCQWPARHKKNQPAGPRTYDAPIGCQIRMLHSGKRTKAYRRTSRAVYHVVIGRGRSIVGDSTLNCDETDVFRLPEWTAMSNEDSSASDPAFLAGGRASTSPVARGLVNRPRWVGISPLGLRRGVGSLVLRGTHSPRTRKEFEATRERPISTRQFRFLAHRRPPSHPASGPRTLPLIAR